MNTTLNKIREHKPCTSGWEKLLRTLGKTKADDEPLSIITILDSNGLDDALWCLRAVHGHEKEMRLYAVWCARQVQHLMKDQRSLAALDVAERFVNNDATKDELNAAEAAAWAAAWAAARTAAGAARAAASDAAGDAAGAAWAAARDAAWAAARTAAGAARAAAWAAMAAAGAARAAAWAAMAAAWDAQEVKFREIFGEPYRSKASKLRQAKLEKEKQE
jgi:hypothetical protein